jgi:predicted enzyme involved in methoxymalonyl-ACP biosynthesis
VSLSTLSAENEERVHELTQRTNQMNFSGTRYDRQTMRSVQQTPYLDTCQDRFGSYGIVGFGVVDRRGPRLTDLMFSCRIQATRGARRPHTCCWRNIANREESPSLHRKTPRNVLGPGLL